jgi:hypothetical protein
MGVRLSDYDWTVLAACQLGGVRRRYKDTPSGILVEYFTMGDTDVTQSITRLERAGRIEPHHITLGVDKEGLKAAMRRVVK